MGIGAPVIVVGTGRCGTSVVARLLETECGVDMGGPHDTGRKSNPGGDWEDQEIKAINEAFANNEITPMQHRIALLSIDRPEVWGFKHPGCANYAHVLQAVFPSASMIWCKRDLDDTAKSFAKAYRRSAESCMNTVLRRHRGLATTIGSRQHTLVLDMTDHRDEDELVDTLKTYLKGRGI